MVSLVPKKDRIFETINSTEEDVLKLYKVIIIYNLTMHFQKKMFGKEEDFCKEAHEVHQKTIKSIKGFYSFNNRDKGQIDGTLQTTDGIRIYLRHVLSIRGERFADEIYEDIKKLCYKYDKGREFKIIPVFQELWKNYWLYNYD